MTDRDHPRHRAGGLFPDDTYLSSTIVGMELVRQRREAYLAATPEEQAEIDRSYARTNNFYSWILLLVFVGFIAMTVIGTASWFIQSITGP